MAPFNPESFSAEEREILKQLHPDRLPVHVAVIMDGNGRWATRQHLPRVVGHRAGVEGVRRTVKACLDLGIRFLTLYSFSTENWTRPDDEVQALMGLIEEQLRTEAAGLHAQGVRIRHLGRRDGLPASLLQALDEAEALTREHATLTLQFAINYSGRAELTDAARALAEQVARGQLRPEAITEDAMAEALYNADVPDPDILIRTAGELRVSNYLLWQIAYSEIWVTHDLWPDFSTRHLLDALLDFQRRHRKFGGVQS